MEYRKLGRTDLQVSVLGFGAAPLGNVYGTVDADEVRRAVHSAVAGGINLFDVSPYYGLTLAEERLGESLVGLRDQVILQTKCGRYGLDEFDFSAQHVTASIDESLRRLKTDYVDVLLAHDVEFGDVQQIIDETIPALRKIQQAGKARYIGISGYPPRTLVRVAKAAPVDIILSYCRYNLLITDMDDVLTPFAQQNGIGLINASSLHMGLLTENGPPDWHPAPSEVREAGRKAVELCRSRGVDLTTVAVRYCLDHPVVASTLLGMCTAEQVQTNLRILSAVTDPTFIHELRSVMASGMNRVWPSGRLENHG